MKVSVNITNVYITFVKSLDAMYLSEDFNTKVSSLLEEIGKTSSLYHKYSTKTELKLDNKTVINTYLEKLNLLKAHTWAQGIQLSASQKKGVTYKRFKELCILLNQEIKHISSLVQEKEPENKPKVFSGKMINYKLNMSCDEEYTLIEESENKKLFLGKKYGHRVYYINDPEVGWNEIQFCDFMSHPIEF